MSAVRFVVAQLLACVVGSAAIVVVPNDPPDLPCPGCISEEVPPDSTLGHVFDDYGAALQSQARAMAQAEGENAAFAEFVPIRYAWQRVAGKKFYVKVRVGEGEFVDLQIYSSWDDSVPPAITSITLRVTEEAPISGTHGGSSAVSKFQASAQAGGCPPEEGCRSDEMEVDADIIGFFNEHADAILKETVAMAQVEGQNAELTELTPVRYAWQRMEEVTVYFVKVGIAANLFADLRVSQSYAEGMLPEVTGLVIGVDEQAPISDFDLTSVV